MDRSTFRKVMALVAALGVTAGLSGCSKQPPTVNGVPGRFEIDENKMVSEGKLENHSSYTISDANVIKVYETNSIFYLVNKKTNEIGIYLYYDGRDSNRNSGELSYLEVLYDLTTEEAVYYNVGNTYYNYDYFKYLEKNNYFVPLTTVLDSIGGREVKGFYSLEEIEEIKDYVLSNTTIKTKTK